MKNVTCICKMVVLVIALHLNLPANAQSEAAVKLFNEGKAFSDKGDKDAAIISFTEAIKLYPDYSDAYNWRGFVYHNKKEYDIAISDFTEAIRLNPNFANIHFNLGKAYYMKDEYDLAIKELTDAIRLDPKDEDSYKLRGNAYHNKKDYASAISDYNQIIRLNPKSPDGYNARAQVYFAKKEYGKAISEYNQIIRIDSTNHEAFSQRANAYRLQKLYNLAISDYSVVLRLAPEELNYYRMRALTYIEKGDTLLALNDFNNYVKLTGTPTSLSSRAWFYAGLKQHNLALNDFAEAIRLDPKNPYLYESRGTFYKKTGLYELALSDFEKGLQINPGNVVLHRYKAEVQKEKGLYRLAIDEYEKALAIYPEFTAMYIDIISSLTRTGQFDRAKKYADKALERSTYLDSEDYSFYKRYLSVIATDLPNENYDRAFINLDNAVKDYATYSADKEYSKSEYIDILALKGYVLEKLSRFKEAKEVYEQALVISSNQPDVKEAIASIGKKSAVVAGNDKTPPVIQLISPQTSRGLQIVSGNKTEIIGKAIDPAGIASVTINGKAITKIEEDGLFISSISLKEGSNNILITAVDKKGNSAAKTFTVNGNTVAKIDEAEIIPVKSTDKVSVYHAILIAEKDYLDPSIADLENPVKDATELKAILENNYTFDAKNIQTLYNKSREEIMQAIVQKSNTLTENDNLLIFYAGHGIAEKDKFGDVDGYWVPSSAKKGLNASYISSDDINKALKRSNSKHILVIADACFSGAFTRELPGDASVGIQKQFSVPSRKIMASGNMEPVPDNSRFVYYLKKNLKENKVKFLTAKKLFDSFYEAILNNSDTSPQYAAIKNVGDEGGEFVFIKK